MAGGPSDADLDDILASALNDFEENEMDAERADRQAAAQERDRQTQAMAKLMDDMQNPEFQETLKSTFEQLSVGAGEMPPLEAFMDTNRQAVVPLPPAEDGEGETKKEEEEEEELEAGVAKTLQQLANASSEMEGMESAQAEQMGEDMMKEMMKEFEKMGEKEDFQNVIDGMMRQLLSKEVMYTPMKQICEKFPEWLAENEAQLAKEDYERYGHQYQYFQQICAVYETEPDNFPRLMELMQDMQECGQPPSEIIKELAPGLEFGPDGMPVMPNMGPGMMPGAGMMEGPNGEKCAIM